MSVFSDEVPNKFASEQLEAVKVLHDQSIPKLDKLKSVLDLRADWAAVRLFQFIPLEDLEEGVSHN